MKNFKLSVGLVLLICCTFSSVGYAQSMPDSLSMSLDECLEYAIENSITLKKAKLEIDNSKASELAAKGAFLPTIAGSVGQSVSSNPFMESSEVAKSSYNGSYGIDLSMNLYNGGKNKATLDKSKVSSEISYLELSEYANTIEVAVTEVYIEILYAIEQIDVCKTSLELSVKNEERGKAFLDAGSINSVDYAQLESAKASAQYDLIVAQSSLSNYYVTLKHLLEISQELTLNVKTPEYLDESLLSIISTVSDVYNAALLSRPEIQSSKLYITSAELDESIAKAGYLPTLKLTAGTGINHSTASDYSFSNQLRDNFSTSAGLTLSIPIFSNYENKTAVSKAKNNIQIAALNLSETEKDLYQTIETLHNNATNAQAKYAVAEMQLLASEKSMNLTSQQYELGMKNTIELLTEQDNYIQSFQEYLINKYQLLYNKAILNYYKTNKIKL
ncbi:MAG: TolC family protein [Bacteroidales bacterium]